MPRPKVYVIHENAEWLPPLRQAFEALGTPYEEWFLDQLVLDLRSQPPQGIFFSRMSASNYTRGHYHATQSTDAVLRWLEAHDRRVINGSRVLALEMSKTTQYLLLARAGFATPSTVVAVGRRHIVDAAGRLGLEPFIVKPNRGGKGLGVRQFASLDELGAALHGDGLPEAADDVWLVQERIPTEEDFITRVEFIGGQFHYAVRVFSGGSFELCPADACEADFAQFCPAEANEPQPAQASGAHFEIAVGFRDPIVRRLATFLADNQIEVAGVEFIRRPDGTPVIYDVNTNTNYNSGAEARAGVPSGGMRRIAEFLTCELAALAPETAIGRRHDRTAAAPARLRG